jgi:hypothetical protein
MRYFAPSAREKMCASRTFAPTRLFFNRPFEKSKIPWNKELFILTLSVLFFLNVSGEKFL